MKDFVASGAQITQQLLLGGSASVAPLSGSSARRSRQYISARWLRIRQKDLLDRYRCDSRRLYEIWWGERFPSSRRKAADRFRELHPNRADRTDFGYRRIPRTIVDPHQNDLFD